MPVAGVPQTAGSATVKVALKSAAMVAGAMPSWSLTPAAVTAIVHCSPAVRSVAGSRVNDVGPPVTAPGCAPLVAQVRPMAPSATVTGSVKLTVTFVLAATPLAPLAGVVDCTAGGTSVTGPCPALLNGSGAPAVKSVAF